jgi:hypothetical protein
MAHAPDGFGYEQEARAAIREVAAWLDTKGQHGCSLWMREELQQPTSQEDLNG